MQVVIVSGERGEGKTTFLRKCADELRRRNRTIFGFYAANVKTPDGNEGYRIYKANSSESLLLCERNASGRGNLKLLDFWFNEQAIKAGEQWLSEGFKTKSPLFLLDEAGKFELDGYVWDNIIKKMLRHNDGTLLMAVRNRFTERIMEKYGINKANSRIVNNLLFTVEFINEIKRG